MPFGGSIRQTCAVRPKKSRYADLAGGEFYAFRRSSGYTAFLCISGVLLLGREYRVKEFYKSSLLPLVLTTEIWMIANYLFVCSPVQDHVFKIDELFREMLFLERPSLSHMWYMPMIIGVYVAL